ncbi:MAG TPA: YCF48-related protein [Bacteroidales bacterium]|nr:YCF48-related protein [Bacteroidales bacterium]HNS47815.1 YCF48-related protein [Bacteroidales bacterium]
MNTIIVKSKAFTLAILLASATALFSQQTGWNWQNPYLQGNDLNSIVMNGVIGWAVGDMGTVMRTINSGNDWELVDLRTSEDLHCIYMNEITGDGWIVGGNGLIFYTDNAGETWSKQYSGTQAALYSIKASGGDCPVICGNDIILRSLDHGETWIKLNCPIHTYFWEVDIIGCDEIWISGNQGLIISSKDDGATWQSHSVPTTHNLLGIDIVPNGDYRACGNQAVIVRSSDGGETWVKENQTAFINMKAVETKGIIGPAYAVGDKGIILETLDGGSTWNSKESGTKEGVILHTTDGGQTWAAQSNPIYGSVDNVFFLDQYNGWVVSNDWWGQIAHTTNGGQDWISQTNPTSNPIVDVFFIDPEKGWAVGKVCNAFPDGRSKGEPLADGVTSPFPGTDNRWPTAVIRSSSKVDHTRIRGGLLNLKFHPSALKNSPLI